MAISQVTIRTRSYTYDKSRSDGKARTSAHPLPSLSLATDEERCVVLSLRSCLEYLRHRWEMPSLWKGMGTDTVSPLPAMVSP